MVDSARSTGQGGLSNLASTGRLNLILEQNARMAYAVGRWQEGMDPDIKERFPCWRYVGTTSAAPRDSHARYAGHVYSKDDPIWHTIFPPSDFNCKCSVEDCDAPAETAPKEVLPAESGFSFDPAHAFEKFDYDAIKDPELRAKTKAGVEKMLVRAKPETDLLESNQFGRTSRTGQTGQTAGTGNQPQAPIYRAFMTNQAGQTGRIGDRLMRFLSTADSEIKKTFYKNNPIEFLKGIAKEMKQRMATEASRKVFPREPKAFLHGKEKKQAKIEARNAVRHGVMRRIYEKVAELGKAALKPFKHYSSKPGDSENIVVRQASFKGGKLDWTGVKVSEERKRAVADLQNLLDIMPKFKGTVYRGCAFDTAEKLDAYLQKLFGEPESLMGFISTTPDPVIAHHYASSGKFKVVVVVPNSQNGVYFGPYSTHPEDEEALISYKFYLKGLKKYEEDGILYVLAEEVAR